MQKALSLISLILSLAACGVVGFYMVKNTDKAPAPAESSSAVQTSDSSSAAEDNTAMQYVMYVGTNDKDTYKQEIPTEEAKKIVDEICLKYFDGYTIQDAVGAWKDETGTITHENSIVCYFDYADEETVKKAADEVIKALNQNTVLIESDRRTMEYYSGK